MSSFGLTLDLKDDDETIERYKEYHRAVWPEVEEALRSIGVTRMRIYLHGRRLFMYMEAVDGFDAARDFPRYMETRAGQGVGRPDAHLPGARSGSRRGGVVGVHGAGVRPGAVTRRRLYGQPATGDTRRDYA